MELNRVDSEDTMKLTIEKCSAYCEKINQYIESSDEDSACPNDKENETKEEMILKTLRNIIKEKKEMKVSLK
jgi:hypothetical protein